MLGKGFSDVGEAKGGAGATASAATTTTGSQFLEQFKTAQALAQLAAQHPQPAGSGSTATSWDIGATAQSSSLVQYGKQPWAGMALYRFTLSEIKVFNTKRLETQSPKAPYRTT